MKRFLLLLFFPLIFSAQIPVGYYNAANGLSGYALKTKLHELISANTTSYNYAEVGSFYPQTDADKYYENDSTVLDIYSEKPNGPDAYNYNFTQNIGPSNMEGLGWNKEHMMPQSTFYSDYPMYSDLFFLVPTDARINQLRSNYPYGVAGTTNFYTFTNGSKISNNATPNSVYTGRVYEPIDEFKGDVARSLLYFITRYEEKLGTFKIDTNTDPKKDQTPLNGTEEKAFEDSFLNLMKVWNAQDPVSQREIDRNNAIFLVQNNRNPFIDHPEWVNLIWDQTLNNIPPVAPNNLATSKVSAYFVNLSWNTSNDPGILGYKIFKDGVYLATTKSNSITLDHLTSGTNYNLSVKSYNNSYLESPLSNILTVATLTSDIYARDLYISKYLEGTDDNKALEITNKTGHSVNLNSYNLGIQFKDMDNYYFPNTFQLEGNIADNEVFLVVNPKANFTCFTNDQGKFRTTAPQMTFDGRNYLALSYKFSTVDAMGLKGIDNSSDLANVSLYRSASVKNPTANFNINQWEKYPVDFCGTGGVLAANDVAAESLDLISIYPNPVSEGRIFAKGKGYEKINTALMYNVSGQLVLKQIAPFKNKNYLNVNTLKTGIYILMLDNQSFKILIK